MHSGFYSKFSFSFEADAPHSFLYSSHDPTDLDAASLIAHIHHLDDLITSFESKVQTLKYTNERIEGDLGDQLSIVMRLSEMIFCVGQEAAASDEEINILRGVIIKRLGKEVLESVERYIADRKSLHALPQVVLTQPEGGWYAEWTISAG